MHINITGQHLEVTDALRDFITSKFSKLEHYFDQTSKVHVVLKAEKINKTAEAILHMTGVELQATATTDDMYIAIDKLVGKLARQLEKHKEKSHKHKPLH